MKTRNRKWLGFFCFLPLLMFFVWGVAYTFYLVQENQRSSMSDHTLSGPASQGYDRMMFLLGLAGLVSAIVLLRLIVHVLRQTYLNNAQKLLWIITLVAFGAFAFPLYWYLKIRVQRGDDRNDSFPGKDTHPGDGLIGDPALGNGPVQPSK